jgi:ISXO2-like transposase domain
VKPGTTLLTDGHASYPGLSGYRHDPRVVGTMAGHVVLPWIHRAFSLLKGWALGTYHGLDPREFGHWSAEHPGGPRPRKGSLTTARHSAVEFGELRLQPQRIFRINLIT